MIVKHSEVPVEPELRNQAIAAMKWMAAESRAEPGVIDYRVTADLEDPNVLRIIEQYEDSEAAQSHGPVLISTSSRHGSNRVSRRMQH